MAQVILSNLSASITELKTDPMGTAHSACGAPLAILSRNKPVFYLISPEYYEAMLDALDDEYLVKLVKSREGEEGIPVNINDL